MGSGMARGRASRPPLCGLNSASNRSPELRAAGFSRDPGATARGRRRRVAHASHGTNALARGAIRRLWRTRSRCAAGGEVRCRHAPVEVGDDAGDAVHDNQVWRVHAARSCRANDAAQARQVLVRQLHVDHALHLRLGGLRAGLHARLWCPQLPGTIPTRVSQTKRTWTQLVLRLRTSTMKS